MGLKKCYRNFKKQIKPVSISYGITVCNEAAELNTLLSVLVRGKQRRDEILVLQDVTNMHESVNAVIEKFKERIRLIKGNLNGDFAGFKNQLIEHASKDYLFQIDADETLPDKAFSLLIKEIKGKPQVEVFLISRENYVNGITKNHIEKWKWNIDDKQRINYPDYQFRILKLNGNIVWKNKVHEVLHGYSIEDVLPPQIHLIHIKSIKKQESQNAFYDTL